MEFYQWEMFHPKISTTNNGHQTQTLWLLWFITITGTTLPFRWARQWLTENPCSKLFTAAVSTRQSVSLGILVFLPSLPGMVKAELPGTHIGWLVLPIKTLANSPSSLMEYCRAFLDGCCCPIVLIVTLSTLDTTCFLVKLVNTRYLGCYE